LNVSDRRKCELVGYELEIGRGCSRMLAEREALGIGMTAGASASSQVCVIRWTLVPVSLAAWWIAL
jgi:hypothetical protein